MIDYLLYKSKKAKIAVQVLQITLAPGETDKENRVCSVDNIQ